MAGLSLDLSGARLKPWAHQIVGVERLVALTEPEIGRIYPGCLLLGDEMGVGKTKQVIDAAQVLYVKREIDTVLILCPAPVRYVWYDPELGELAQHLWTDLPSTVTEYHKRPRTWRHGPESKSSLRWIITNYEFIRINYDRVTELLRYCGDRTWLVADESSAVKSHRAEQTKATMKLRKPCPRVTELNGTPISHSPLDMYSQAAILDPRILGKKSFFHFRASYAVMGGFQGKQILGWHHLDELQAKMAPYVLRRLKIDCMDLPEKLPPVALSVPLDPKTWRAYKDMRDDLCSWLDGATVSEAKSAGTKIIRLAQLTSGFLGGLVKCETCDECGGLGGDCQHCGGTGVLEEVVDPQVVGDEKLKFTLNWIEETLDLEPAAKLMVWCRFRAELDRLATAAEPELKRRGGQVVRLWGSQSRDERQHFLRMMNPRTTTPHSPVLGVGTPGTGSMGLSMVAASYALYQSNDPSMFKRLQSEDRLHRGGQTKKVWYGDVVATGPDGQKTYDGVVIAALRARQDLANWTCSAWATALREE